eukprot:gene16599-13668_t
MPGYRTETGYDPRYPTLPRRSDTASMWRFFQVETFYAEKALEYVQEGMHVDDAVKLANGLKVAAHDCASALGLCTPATSA